MKPLKIILLAVVLSASAGAHADGVPFGGAAVGTPSATALAIQCPNGTLSCFGAGGSSAAATQPIAVTPLVIVAANTYQQAAPSGRATTSGGFIQPNAGNAGLICVDVSAGAAVGRTTPTGGQICQIAVGSSALITFPATSGAVYVYGTVKGDIFSGSVS